MSRALLSPRRWLTGNGINLAPLTGQDARALDAIAACWEVYVVSDDAGRSEVREAVASLLLAMQPKCRILTRELIARSLDWGDVDLLWRLVTARVATIEAGRSGPAAYIGLARKDG